MYITHHYCDVGFVLRVFFFLTRLTKSVVRDDCEMIGREKIVFFFYEFLMDARGWKIFVKVTCMRIRIFTVQAKSDDGRVSRRLKRRRRGSRKDLNANKKNYHVIDPKYLSYVIITMPAGVAYMYYYYYYYFDVNTSVTSKQKRKKSHGAKNLSTFKKHCQRI